MEKLRIIGIMIKFLISMPVGILFIMMPMTWGRMGTMSLSRGNAPETRSPPETQSSPEKNAPPEKISPHVKERRLTAPLKVSSGPVNVEEIKSQFLKGSSSSGILTGKSQIVTGKNEIVTGKNQNQIIMGKEAARLWQERFTRPKSADAGLYRRKGAEAANGYRTITAPDGGTAVVLPFGSRPESESGNTRVCESAGGKKYSRPASANTVGGKGGRMAERIRTLYQLESNVDQNPEKMAWDKATGMTWEKASEMAWDKVSGRPLTGPLTGNVYQGSGPLTGNIYHATKNAYQDIERTLKHYQTQQQSNSHRSTSPLASRSPSRSSSAKSRSTLVLPSHSALFQQLQQKFGSETPWSRFGNVQNALISSQKKSSDGKNSSPSPQSQKKDKNSQKTTGSNSQKTTNQKSNARSAGGRSTVSSADSPGQMPNAHYAQSHQGSMMADTSLKEKESKPTHLKPKLHKHPSQIMPNLLPSESSLGPEEGLAGGTEQSHPIQGAPVGILKTTSKKKNAWFNDGINGDSGHSLPMHGVIGAKKQAESRAQDDNTGDENSKDTCPAYFKLKVEINYREPADPSEDVKQTEDVAPSEIGLDHETEEKEKSSNEEHPSHSTTLNEEYSLSHSSLSHSIVGHNEEHEDNGNLIDARLEDLKETVDDVLNNRFIFGDRAAWALADTRMKMREPVIADMRMKMRDGPSSTLNSSGITALNTVPNSSTAVVLPHELVESEEFQKPSIRSSSTTADPISDIVTAHTSHVTFDVRPDVTESVTENGNSASPTKQRHKKTRKPTKHELLKRTKDLRTPKERAEQREIARQRREQREIARREQGNTEDAEQKRLKDLREKVCHLSDSKNPKQVHVGRYVV